MQYIIIIILIISILILQNSTTKLKSNLSNVNLELHKIKKKIGIEEATKIDEELKSLIKKNNKIESIKKARILLKLNLMDAKNYIDTL